MQLHRMTANDATSTPGGGQPLHGRENTERVANPRPRSAVERLARRAAGNATDRDRCAGRKGFARALSARARRAAAWLLMSCLALGLASPQASAQAVKLVSNSSATGPATSATVDEDVTQTQQFTTGSHPTGYSLNAVILDAHTARPMATLSVSIYEESSGDPGNNIATLSGGTGVTQGLTNTFTAPQGTILAPETKYFVFIEGTDSNAASLLPTSGDGEDTDSADGWSIADSRRFRTTDGGAWRSDSSALRLTVRGTLIMPPTITDMEVTSDPGIDETYGIGHTANVTVQFSEQISVDTSSGTPQLMLNIGESTEPAACAAHATDLGTLVCSYEIAENDADTDGISIGANSLTLNGATITYRGTTVSAELDHVGVPSNPEHKVNGDPTVPTITNIVFTSSPSFSSDTYGEDEMVEFSLIFSHVVWITGTPLAQMNVGGDYPRIPLYAGSGTNTLRFRYTVQSGESDNDGVSIVQHTLAPGGTLSGGIDADPAGSATIQTSAGVNATIRNQPTGTQAGHKVDGTMRSGMTVPNAPTAVTATPDGADAIHIAWTAPTFPGSSAISAYRVEWSTTGSAPWTLAGSTSETMLDHTELTAMTTYHYRVTAINGSGNGTPSGSASATTAADLVCGRTSAIADAITAAARVASCKKVTAAQLGEITSLDASDKSMTSLANGDLSGLSSLTTLDLSGNAFTSIPSGPIVRPATVVTPSTDRTMGKWE